MVTFTTTAVIQLLAVLSIPTIVGFIAATQMNTRAKFQWKQGRIALLLTMVPMVLILSLQGILSTMLTVAALVALVAAILLIRPDQN